MQFGAANPSMSSRLTSLGLVGALHGLIVLGLSAGLIREALQAPPGPIVAEVLKPEPAPEPDVKPITDDFAEAPVLRAPDTPVVPPPDWDIAPATGPTITSQWDEGLPKPTGTALRGEPAAELPPAVASGPVSAGLLCPTMARPELPAAAQEGSAMLRVLGTVRGGRVVAVQMTTLQALPDRRAQRALLANVEQALRSGYACTQDGLFEQEFLFRVE